MKTNALFKYINRGRYSQGGASLIVTLIFLIVMSILGLAAIRVASLEERMSGNVRDRSLAFQAAEAALRDAEADIDCLKYDRSGPSSRARSPCISGISGADAVCTNGLCCNVSDLTCKEPATPVEQSVSFTGAPSVAYGQYTEAPQISGLSLQPRYVIEPFYYDDGSYYRITVRGYGVNPNTKVTLQEIYKKG